MTYITKTNEKHSRFRFDSERFAKDLAKALGHGAQYAGLSNGWAEINIGDNVIDIGFSEWKGMASVSIGTRDLKHGEWSSYAAEQRVHSATINPDGRTITAIAKDVQRRVIDANLPALEARRVFAAERRAARDQLALTLGRLKEVCPSLSISKRDPEAESASVYNSDPYITATVDADGRIRIERMEAMSLAQFAAILEVMEKPLRDK